MEIYDVVKKLAGNVSPVGETNEDNRRFENLKQTTELIDRLVFDIVDASKNKDRQEYSMKKAGTYAYKFLEELKLSLE